MEVRIELFLLFVVVVKLVLDVHQFCNGLHLLFFIVVIVSLSQVLFIVVHAMVLLAVVVIIVHLIIMPVNVLELVLLF